MQLILLRNCLVSALRGPAIEKEIRLKSMIFWKRDTSRQPFQMDARNFEAIPRYNVKISQIMTLTRRSRVQDTAFAKE
ncbi:hypothetical protein AA309_16595 [Microvirga vignae]|uniref:Uncharacterized protein n=1 Tax=Microvirga vignae TaxID=1225564 RepID=A0A0H1RB03_9HYPH|nr:hypothetical protein AA309_16595 [Microvirga vignae]